MTGRGGDFDEHSEPTPGERRALAAEGAAVKDSLTPDVAAIRARAEAATPGPWRAEHRHVACTDTSDELDGLGLDVYGPPEASMRGMYERAGDAQFIAHARTDIPALLAHNAELEAERNELRRESNDAWAALSAVGNTARFMDPPDGGSPTLAEFVQRMGEALAKAERAPLAIDEWKIWSIVRDAMMSGVRLVNQPGGYERYSALMDATASEYANKITAALIPPATERGA